jgi:thiol:disulfide interchange protein
MPRTRKLIRFSLFTAMAAILFSVVAVSVQAADRVIYPAPEQAQTDLDAGLKAAAASHKHVIVDFGGNWCGDCHVLEIYFHDPANRSLLEANYVLVPVNIGHEDANLDIAARYGVPVAKGVPALAVLEPSGQVVYSQRNGEFEAMRTLDSASVTAFLQQWKG